MTKLISTLTCPYGLKAIYFAKAVGDSCRIEIVDAQRLNEMCREDARVNSVPLLIDKELLLCDSDMIVCYFASRMMLRNDPGGGVPIHDLFPVLQHGQAYATLNKALMSYAKSGFSSLSELTAIKSILVEFKNKNLFNLSGLANTAHEASLLSFIVRLKPYTSVYSKILVEVGIYDWAESVLNSPILKDKVFQDYALAFTEFIFSQSGLKAEGNGEFV